LFAHAGELESHTSNIWPKPVTDQITRVQITADHVDQFGANCYCSTRGFHWRTGKRMYDGFAIRGKKFLAR